MSLVQFLNKHENKIIVLILITGLILRLLLIFSIEEPIDKDAEEYYKIATNIVAGKGFTIDGENPTLRRSPGYPFLLASIMTVLGRNPKVLYLFQALLNISTIFLVYLCFKHFKIAGIINFAIISLFTISTSFIYINVLYATIPTMFFISLLMFLYLKMENSYKKSIMTGIIIGVMIYIRPTFLYFPLFIFLSIPLFYFIKLQQNIPQVIIISITAILTILPWTIRNKAVSDKWITLLAAGGKELWMANVEISQKTTWYSVTNIQKYEEQRTKSSEIQNKLISDFRTQYNLSDREDLNRFLSRQAKINILQHPFRYALLCINRFLIFWFSPPIGATTIKSISPILFWMILIIKYLITILAITGLWQLSKYHFHQFYLIILLVVYLTLLHSAVHAIQRYSLPLLPIAYFAFGYMIERFKINNTRKLI